MLSIAQVPSQSESPLEEHRMRSSVKAKGRSKGLLGKDGGNRGTAQDPLRKSKQRVPACCYLWAGKGRGVEY